MSEQDKVVPAAEPTPAPVVATPAPEDIARPLVKDPALEEARKRIEASEAELKKQADEQKAADIDPAIKSLQEQVQKLETENAKLKKRINDEDGRRGSELEKLKGTVATQHQTIEKLTSEIDTLRAAKPSAEPAAAGALPTADGDVMEAAKKILTEDEFDAYGEAIPVIKKLMQAFSPERPKKADPAPDAPPAAAKESATERGYVPTEADRKLCMEIEKLCPGFIQDVNPPAMGGSPNPSWLAFLDTPKDLNNPNETWATELSGEVTPDLGATVYRAYLDWKSRGKDTPPSSGADGRPDLRDLASPRTKGASTAPQSERTYRRADYERLKKQMTDPANRSRYRELLREFQDYQQAAAEGRLT